LAESVGKVGDAPTSAHGLKANAIGFAPGIRAVLLSYIFVKALFNFSGPANAGGAK
jgi:hypothetical protein